MTERNARVVIAVLGVIAAALGTLTAVFAASKSDVVQQRDDVRGDVSTPTTQQSNLRDQVTRLKSENADRRHRLDASSADSNPTGDSSDGAQVRNLKVPLPAAGASTEVSLDEPRVAQCCTEPDFIYELVAPGRGRLKRVWSAGMSIAVDSANVSKEQCSQAANGSPVIRPIPPPRAGLMCALSHDGISLLRIVKQKNGTLSISQKYWLNP